MTGRVTDQAQVEESGEDQLFKNGSICVPASVVGGEGERQGSFMFMLDVTREGSHAFQAFLG